ncbi:MAG: hypothetical protein BMS9Abin25_1018 [Gammaproteobacteria bacterium]|nr:MAG: hypothetical protein BMS9Abin25_1018 [Gammaproteobacteria bacterium]
MKKFILVDNQGNTSDQQHIETGKFHMREGVAVDKSVAVIMNSGDNSPILAVMNYPGTIDDGLKMFLLHVWSLDNEGYSIVKEVELPTITTEHKLVFAIKAVGAIYDFPAYKKWADGWICESDRSMDSIKAITSKVEEEIKELESIQKVSYSMGLDLDEKDGVKKAQFERARVVFHAAALAQNSLEDKFFNTKIAQVFNGIEEFVDSESLVNMSDEILQVA